MERCSGDRRDRVERPLLEMRGISKAFPGVKALDDVNFRIFPGEVMALLGENGAGKSTLVKVLGGVYHPDGGAVFLDGRQLAISSPKDAMEQGIAIIHQELNLIPGLCVGENIFLGREPVGCGGRINRKKMMADAKDLLDYLRTSLDPRQSAAGLSIGDQQMVEIAKALSMDARILVFDEPTDALTDQEAEHLFQIIRELKERGRGLTYISHRLAETFEICDRVTVLRDGIHVGERPVSELDEDGIIEMMVGRRLEDQLPYEQVERGDVRLKVEGLTSDVCVGVDMEVHRGEILGLAGLMGAGRTELALTLFGIHPATSGRILLDGEEVRIDSPAAAIGKGIAYVSEDRKQLGLFLGMSVKDNMTLTVLKQFENFFFRTDDRRRNRAVDRYVRDLSIKTYGHEQRAGDLSGGNQQKVSIARGLMSRPKLLILDEPTRGVDVGAKKEIYRLINRFKADGLAIIMISSAMPELMGMSDRIAVMHDHTVAGELSRAEATQESMMRLAIGTDSNDAGRVALQPPAAGHQA